MRISIQLLMSGVCALLALPIVAEPATPINIHGQLLSSGGEPVSGSRAFTVSFFDAATDGNAIGTAVTGTVDVSADGLFNLAVPPPSGIYATEEVWYSIGVDTDEPSDSDATDDIFPSRIRVYYVPLAVQALRALNVDATGVGTGTVDNTELDMLNDVTSNVQAQIDAIDTAAISQHTTDIATNAANIATNTTDITANAADIATNTTDIAANAADIATNTTDIAANAADIATNTTDIAANTANIADNTTNITTNATNIANNTTAIALKANSADVYTKVAADAKFLGITGGTMTGALGVDTIGEATPSNGVLIDGVKLQDNFVELANIAAPSVTTGKLYRTGADLFWNGTQLNNGGGVDTDTVQFTAGYIFGAASTVLKHTMPKSGTIVRFEIYGNYSTGSGAVVDFLVNGVSAIEGGPVVLLGDTVDMPSLFSGAFVGGDVFELHIDPDGSELLNIAITLVVEY